MMPFKSESQRRWMWANDPEMAQRWANEEKKMKSKKSKKASPKGKMPKDTAMMGKGMHKMANGHMMSDAEMKKMKKGMPKKKGM